MIDVWRVDVALELLEPLLGTVPRDPKAYDLLFGAGGPDGGLRGSAATPDQAAEERAHLPGGEEEGVRPGWTGFYTDEDGPYLYDYQVLGYVKDKGNLLKGVLGVTALRSKIDQALSIHPRRIRPQVPAGVTQEPITRPLRAQTMQGPRVTVARSDALPPGTRLAFQIQVYPAFAELTPAVLAEIFALGEQHGLGQWRNAGWGRFRVTQFAVQEHAARPVNPVLAAWLPDRAASAARRGKGAKDPAADGAG